MRKKVLGKTPELEVAKIENTKPSSLKDESFLSFAWNKIRKGDVNLFKSGVNGIREEYR